jgi:hypothetical protein
MMFCSHGTDADGKKIGRNTGSRGLTLAPNKGHNMATWKLKKPDIKLSKKQIEWFSWAEEAAIEILDDADWLRDNIDADTVAGQIDDMRYRLEVQGESVAGTDATPRELASRTRALSCLIKKLDEIGYFTHEYHERTPR